MSQANDGLWGFLLNNPDFSREAIEEQSNFFSRPRVSRHSLHTAKPEETHTAPADDRRGAIQPTQGEQTLFNQSQADAALFDEKTANARPLVHIIDTTNYRPTASRRLAGLIHTLRRNMFTRVARDVRRRLLRREFSTNV